MWPGGAVPPNTLRYRRFKLPRFTDGLTVATYLGTVPAAENFSVTGPIRQQLAFSIESWVDALEDEVVSGTARPAGGPQRLVTAPFSLWCRSHSNHSRV
jgi:hypothetical protein